MPVWLAGSLVLLRSNPQLGEAPNLLVEVVTMLLRRSRHRLAVFGFTLVVLLIPLQAALAEGTGYQYVQDLGGGTYICSPGCSTLLEGLAWWIGPWLYMCC